MIRSLGLTAALCVLYLIVLMTQQAAVGASDPAAQTTMALGFVLVVSFFAGKVAASLNVPSITGYILTGVIFGPYVLSQLSADLVVLNAESVRSLQTLDGAALGLIALTAGGELRISILKEKKRSIIFVIAAHVSLVLVGVAGFFYLASGLFPSFAAIPPASLLAGCLLLGVTAVAKSPATTIAVLQESKAKGPLSDIVLAVTVAKDVVVVILFTIVIALCLTLVDSERAQDSHVLGELAWELFGSFGVGIAAGWLMTLYMRRVGSEVPLLVLAVAFLSGTLGEEVHLSGLLVCMVAGFTVENFSEHGEELIHAIERHSLPLYVVFFTITGASLDLNAILSAWPLALALVLARLTTTFAATALGCRLAGEPRAVQLHAWTGFLGQAGVTLGFAAIIAKRFPEVGELLKTVIIAAVAMNQIIGPILFRWGLNWAGEAGKGGGDETVSDMPALDASGASAVEMLL